MGDSYAVTWLAVALSGLGVAAYHPQAARSARAASGGMATGMSWFALGGNLGFAVGPVATTAVLAATGPSGTPLLALPALATAALFATARRRPAGLRSRGDRPVSRPDRWGPFLWLSAVVVARSVLFFGLSTFLALYLRDRFGADPEAASAALTLLGLLADHSGLRAALLTLVVVPILALADSTRLPEPRPGPATEAYV